MDNTLDTIVDNSSSGIDIDTFLSDVNTPVRLPAGANKTEAAVTAFSASTPGKVVEDYRALTLEGEQGRADYRNRLKADLNKQEAQAGDRTVVQILSDPNVPFDKKQAIVQFAQAPVPPETRKVLMNKNLVADNPSEDGQQAKVRTNIGNLVNKIQKDNEEAQGLVNQHIVSLDSSTVRATGELAEAWVMPFATNITTGKLYIELSKKLGKKPTLWDYVKAYGAPGTAMREMADAYANGDALPIMKAYQQALSENPGILFSKDNHFNQWDKLTNLQDYGSGAEFVDNASTLLDIIGLGESVRSAGKIIRAGSAVERANAIIGANVFKLPNGELARVEPTLDASGRAGKAPTSGFEPTKVSTPSPEGGEASRALTALEDERASLLGDSSGLLPKGGVKTLTSQLPEAPSPSYVKERTKELQEKAPYYKGNKKLSYQEAKKQAEQEFADMQADYQAKTERITGQLEGNIASSQNEQRLAQLDKQIEELKKQQVVGGGLKSLTDEMNRIEWGSVFGHDHPASVANIFHQTNPDRARALYSDIVNSTTDELSQATHGVSRSEAIAKDTLPQVTTPNGNVVAKTPDVDRLARLNLNVPAQLLNIMHSSGRLELSSTEKAAARANVVNDFQNAGSLTINNAMSSFSLGDDGRILIDAVYGSTEGGFLRAEDAARQAMHSLKKYGVTEDSIEILQRQGKDYKVVDKNNIPTGDGDFHIRVKTSHEVDPNDLSRMDETTVRWNFFDRVKGFVTDSMGSVSRHIFDATSMLDPLYSSAASRASDLGAKFEKELLQYATRFTDDYIKLPKARQGKMDEYIKEANFKEIKFDVTDLTSRGFTPSEVDALRKWRDFWDIHYYLENFDLVRSLNAQGYQVLSGSKDVFFAKRVEKNINTGNLYDPSLGRTVVPTRAEMDNLYNTGGHYAKLRRPTVLNGELVENIVVRNTPTEYLRKITDQDQVLNYRHGYYQMVYKAPKFVDEITTVGAQKIRKTIAVAGDTAEAESFRKNKAAASTNANVEYVIRGNERALARDTDEFWDLNSASGRIAQRQRGQLLEDASGQNHLGDQNFIEDPISSSIRAAKSIGGRTISRPVIETAKARAIRQYSAVMPSDGMGGKRWPKSVEEIGSKGEFSNATIRDARTTYEYINYIENGYINAIDTGVKAFFNTLATTAGELSQKGVNLGGLVSKAERGANLAAEGRGPMSLAKNTVFMAYLGSNPLAQLVKQPHQAIRMMAYNPTGWFSGNITKLTAELFGSKMNLVNKTDFTKFMDDSGLIDAIDHQNLVRGSLVDAADSSSRSTKYAAKTAGAVRQVGFDAGEAANMVIHGAAVFDAYKRAGKNLSSKVVKDEAYAEIRALSGEMNFAGDMPYNQNALSVVFQFMQVPHKAFLQMANRKLPWQTRFKLVAGDLVLFGTPAYAISQWMTDGDILPEDQNSREMLTEGLVFSLYNRFADVVTGDLPNTHRIDFTVLNPYDMSGFSKILSSMYSGGGLETVVLTSPSGQLLLKEDGRLGQVMASVSRMFNPYEEDTDTPEQFMDVVKAAARISSGWTNAEKAKLMLDTGKRLDAMGNVVQDKTTKMDALAQLLGFGSYDQKQMIELAKHITEFEKKHKKEIDSRMKDVKRYVTDQLDSSETDFNHIMKTTGILTKIYADDPKALAYIQQQWSKDMLDGDARLMRQMLYAAGYPDSAKLRDSIKMGPGTNEDKQKALKLLEDINNLGKEAK